MNVYLLENSSLSFNRDGVYWIDAEKRVLVGVPENFDDILDLIEEEEIDIAFISHIHDIGPVHELQERAGCQIILHKDDGDPIKNIRKVVLAKDRYKIAPKMTLIHCPGHTPGSSFLKYEYSPKKYCLFTGDTLAAQNGKVVLAPPQYSQNTDLMVKSIKQIVENHEFEAILPSWGEQILQNARQMTFKMLSEL